MYVTKILKGKIFVTLKNNPVYLRACRSILCKWAPGVYGVSGATDLIY